MKTQIEQIEWHKKLDGFDKTYEDWVLIQLESGIFQSIVMYYEDYPDNKKPVFMPLGESTALSDEVIAWADDPHGWVKETT